MFKRALLLIAGILIVSLTYGQDAAYHVSENISHPPIFGSRQSHLRISLLTCGPGDNEIYEVFGHTAVRVVDSAAGMDIVYNYGTFDYGPDFEWQFMRGKLLYSLSIDPFDGFVSEYVEAGRSVQEQELLMSDERKIQVADFLRWNSRPENRHYKYDFFFDNCATRIRDIFTRKTTYGTGFVYGNVLKPGEDLAYRHIMNRYFYRDHWTRLGVNILLGSKIDRVMTNADIMFLPDYLRDGIGGATVNGQKIAAPAKMIIDGKRLGPAGINWPLLATSVFAILLIISMSFAPLQQLGRVLASFLLFVTGLLGLIILAMWFATDHQGCSNNFNILWALPSNLVVAFVKPRRLAGYVRVAAGLVLVSMLLHLVRIQGLVPEFVPVLVALLFVYFRYYRISRSYRPAV